MLCTKIRSHGSHNGLIEDYLFNSIYIYIYLLMVKYIYYLLYIHIHIVDVCRCIDVYIIDREPNLY